MRPRPLASLLVSALVIAACGRNVLDAPDVEPSGTAGSGAGGVPGPADTVCEAAATDPWTLTYDFEVSDCAARLDENCGSPAAAGATGLERDVLLFLQRMCNLPAYHVVRLELTGGCVNRYEIKTLTGSPVLPGVAACLEVLRKFRFTCAKPMDCAMVEWDTAP
jgi:hypothetical protein